MFSAVDAVLLRPLPFASPERLVLISATSPMSRGGSQTRRGGDLSPADFLDYRSASSFEGWLRCRPIHAADRRRHTGARAGRAGLGKFFLAAGSERARRAVFLPADDAPGRPAQAVISEALWERRYGRAANLIGRAITVSDQRVEVVGIAPAGFRFEDKVEIWLLGDRGIPRFSSIRESSAESRRPHAHRRRPPSRGRLAVGSAGGARRHRRATGSRVPKDEQRLGHGPRPAAYGARGTHAADADAAAGRGRAHAADRLGERREPHAGADEGTGGRVGDAQRARRLAGPRHPSDCSPKARFLRRAAARSGWRWPPGV